MSDGYQTTQLLERVTERLREQLVQASSTLQAAVDDVLPTLRPLHGLQAWCDAIFAEAALETSITLVFLLDHILEESFENLAGDFRYDPKADEVRRGFFRRLGAGLGELAGSDLANPSAWASITDRLLSDYRDVIAEIDRHQLAQRDLAEEG